MFFAFFGWQTSAQQNHEAQNSMLMSPVFCSWQNLLKRAQVLESHSCLGGSVLACKYPEGHCNRNSNRIRNINNNHPQQCHAADRCVDRLAQRVLYMQLTYTRTSRAPQPLILKPPQSSTPNLLCQQIGGPQGQPHASVAFSFCAPSGASRQSCHTEWEAPT